MVRYVKEQEEAVCPLAKLAWLLPVKAREREACATASFSATYITSNVNGNGIIWKRYAGGYVSYHRWSSTATLITEKRWEA